METKNNLPIYLLNGKRVFLADTREAEKLGLQPIESFINTSAYAEEDYKEGLDCCLTEDDMMGGYTDPMEIGEYDCMAIADKQCILPMVCSVYWREVDEFEREYCILTDRYYDWTSEAKRMQNGMLTNGYKKIEKSRLESLRQEWETAIEEAEKKISKDNPYEVSDPITFEELLEGFEIIDDTEDEEK